MYGILGEVNFNIGKGALRKPTGQQHDKVVLGFKSGRDRFLKKPSDEFKPADVHNNILENSSNQEISVFEVSSEKPYEQLGQGFWVRFFIQYTEYLSNGKNKACFFIS